MMMADLRSLTADICSLFSAFLISAFEHLSLALYGGIHRRASGYFVLLAKDFPMPSTIKWKPMLPSFGVCWIVAVIPAGSRRN